MEIGAVTSAVAYEKSSTIAYDRAKSTAIKSESTTASAKEEKLSVTDTGFVFESSESSYESNSLVVAYDKDGESTKKTKNNAEIVEQMKNDLEQRKNQLEKLVEQMLHRQGRALVKASDIWDMIRKGEVEVDPETSAQAQKDIAEDGYWGVEQTSDRLVSFAKALSGDNPAYADKLIDAVKKGFDEATKAWGDKLPDISQKTLDATIEKMEKWRDGLE